MDLEILKPGVSMRRAPTLRIVESPTREYGHCEVAKNHVVRMVVPRHDTALGRAVRYHELIHATRSPLRIPSPAGILPAAIQAVEDMRVHTVLWPSGSPRQVVRDTRAMALRELRYICDTENPTDPEGWNRRVIVLLRCLAIVTEGVTSLKSGVLGGLRRGLQARLSELILVRAGQCVRQVRSLAQRGAGRNTRILWKLVQTLMAQPSSLLREGKKAAPSSPGGLTSARMGLVHLPPTELCDPHGYEPRPSASGIQLDLRAVVRWVSGTATDMRLFRRRSRTAQAGTILIDASASMRMGPESLAALCAAAPAATVAYYVGLHSMEEESRRYAGLLYVYARDGYRASADSIEIPGTGNDVDLEAVSWLLGQDGPRVIVTDGEFCGGPEGYPERAMGLLLRAVAAQECVWVHSLEEATALFRELRE